MEDIYETMNAPFRRFLELPYEELEEVNLEFKKERAKKLSDEHYRERTIQYLKDQKGIKSVSVCFTDLEGKMLRLDYDKSFVIECDDNLTFDGSSIRGFTPQNDSDLRLVIDWSSIRVLPADLFGPGKALVFANVHDQDGTSYVSDFRGVLSNLTKSMYKGDKMEALASTEVEGFLLEGIDAEQKFNEEEGFPLVTKGGYFNALPLDPLRDFINNVEDAIRAMGMENEKNHPEVAPSQFEINYRYSDILEASDNVQMYKLICRQMAKNMGYTVSFLPKPVMNINGSGMHTNVSLSKDGVNLFYNGDDKNNLSDTAYDFLTGILYHAKDICMTLNSSVNSYRRLDPAYEAPNEIKYSPNDRGSMVRIPLGNKKSARIEVRSVAPDCNPYLEMFTILKAGLKGVEATGDEKKELQTVHNKREKLPGNIYDAMRYFKRSTFIDEVMGADNKKKFAALKDEVAHRSPRDLGSVVKKSEVLYHHEITNQSIWSTF
jgi:glutamine synthetase